MSMHTIRIRRPRAPSRFWSGIVAMLALSAAFAAGPPAQRASADAFTSQGLNYERELMAIYLGDFAHARLQRLTPDFTTLFARYLEAFSRQCSASLPADREPITRRQCAVETYRTNRYGTQMGPSSCTQYVDVATGFYADPTMYQAKLDLEEQYSSEIMKRMLSGGIPQALTGAIDAGQGLADDLDTMLRTNTCNGAGTRRFQDNLLRFATGQPALLLPGSPTLASLQPKSATPAGATDASITRLLSALIADNAQGWISNRYIANSVDEVTVKRDAEGRPGMVSGYYLYDGGGGRKVGTVRVQFQDGAPTCLFFGDAPTTCRAASRRVITAFEKGTYEQASR